MTLAEILEKVKTEHSAAFLKHGPWRELPDDEQQTAIMSEVLEALNAKDSGDIHGEHGEIREWIQVMTVAARRIMAITGEFDA